MKKIKMMMCCLLLGGLVCGCDRKENIDTYASLSNGEAAVSSKKNGLTIGEIYDYLRSNNGNDEIVKNIVKKAMKDQIDFTKSDNLDLYKSYINNKFKEEFIDGGNSDNYKYNGEFSEKLLVEHLESQLYDIKCDQQNNSSLLDSKYFSCDYSDYIERKLNYDAYLYILKINDLIDNHSNLIDFYKGRRVSYYLKARSSGTDTSVREEFEGYVKDFVNNKDLPDADDLIKDLDDIAIKKLKERLETIQAEYDTIEKSDDSSKMYVNLSKYTTCGDFKCTKEDGKKYQIKKAEEEKYIISEIVTRENTTVLYEAARELIFSDNIDDYLYEIGTKKYLVSPVYGIDGMRDTNDIILFNSSNYYLVQVDVIDSSSDRKDQILIAEKLLDKIPDNDVILECLEKSNIKIYDKHIENEF